MSQLKSSSECPNKRRSYNFSSEEVRRLKELISKHRVLVNRKTDHVCVSLKKEAWRSIYREFNQFNSRMGMALRSQQQLKNKFDNMKKKIQKEITEWKESGQDPGQPQRFSSTAIWLRNLMRDEELDREKNEDGSLQKPDEDTHLSDHVMYIDVLAEDNEEAGGVQGPASPAAVGHDAQPSTELMKSSPQSLLSEDEDSSDHPRIEYIDMLAEDAADVASSLRELASPVVMSRAVEEAFPSIPRRLSAKRRMSTNSPFHQGSRPLKSPPQPLPEQPASVPLASAEAYAAEEHRVRMRLAEERHELQQRHARELHAAALERAGLELQLQGVRLASARLEQELLQIKLARARGPS